MKLSSRGSLVLFTFCCKAGVICVFYTSLPESVTGELKLILEKSPRKKLILAILFFFFFIVVDFVIHWNETALGLHVSFLLESPLIKLRLCFLSPANCVSIWFSQHSQAKRSCGSPLRHLSGCLYLNFGQIMYTHHQSLVFIIQECVSYSVLDIHKMIIMFQ